MPADASKGLTLQQRGLLAEFYARERAGRGAQTVHDFAGFTVTKSFSTRRWVLSESAVASAIVRLKSRGLLQIVFGGRPRTFGLTDVGRDVAQLAESSEGGDE